MSDSLLPSNDAILTELAALQNYLLAAQQKLEAGEIMGVEGIEDRVSQLCKNVMAAPPELGQSYLPGLTALIESMNHYEKDLRTRSAALIPAAPQDGDGHGGR